MTLRAPDWPPCHRCRKPSKPSEQVRYEGNVYCCPECAPLEAQELAQGTLRAQVLERDHGVCVLCKVDCLKLRASLDELKAKALGDAPDKPSRARDAHEVRVLSLVQHGFPRSILEEKGSLWAADHIEPRVLGGPTNIRNARTVCLACHAGLPAELARDRPALRPPLRGRR